jgi:hypothetical protein
MLYGIVFKLHLDFSFISFVIFLLFLVIFLVCRRWPGQFFGASRNFGSQRGLSMRLYYMF